MSIAFLGGGNMASALIGGLIAKGTKRGAISVVEQLPAARRRLAARFKVRASAAPDARSFAADTLVLAVKPQDMRTAVAPLAGRLAGKLVISVAAGRLALETVLGSALLAARSKEPPGVLRERVTSRGGTTAAALKVFEEEALAERFRRAVEAASRRGAEMGEEYGKEAGKD